MKTEPGIIAHGDEINGQQVIIAKPTKMNFEELKKEILKRAKDNDACKSGYGQALGSTDHKTLLQAIKDNIAWWVNHKVVDADFLDLHFGIEMLNELNIYTSGKHNLSFNKNIYLVLLGSSSANVETWDSSSANVKTLGNSSANVETWDSSSANVETWGSSSANVKTWGSSSANVKTWDSSSANVKTLGSSSANVETLGSSSANVKTWGSSSANVETWGSSSANVETLGNSSKLTHSLGNGAGNLIKHMNERKIYVRKSDFEIVEI